MTVAALPMPPGQTPRGWQLLAADAAREGLRRYRRCLLIAATGTGKGSLMAGLAVRSAMLGRRVLLLAHRDELVAELVARIRKVEGSPPVGLVKAEFDQWDAQIVVASVQSCTPARRQRMPRFDIILVDEAHHGVSPSYLAIFDAAAGLNPEVRVLGFTATGFRSGADGATEGLGGVFEAVVFDYGIGPAIAAGDLVPLRAFQVQTTVDLTSVRIVGGDFDEGELQRAVDTPERNELVVDQYIERAPGLPCLVFAAGVAHSKHIAEAFVARGIRAAAAWGDMPIEDRRSLVAQFRRADGSLPVLVSCDLVREGFDAPATRLVLKARPTKSRVVFVQMVGRVLRLSPGKAEGLFVDLVDNGCSLDLSCEPDLSDPGRAESKTSRTLQGGDQVRRLHHDAWGIGIVEQVTPGAMPLAKVEWPPSQVHRDGATLHHPCAELQFVPGDVVRKPVQLQLGGRLTAKAYEVFLLPGVRKADRVGFYEYRETYSVGGTLAAGTLFTVLVKRSAKGQCWETWEHRGMVATRRHEAADRDLAICWADSHVRASGCLLEAVGAPGHDEPADASQRRLLGLAGVARSLDGMTRGEASALLRATHALRAVRAVEDPVKFRKAEAIRDRFRQNHRRGAA